MSTEQPPRIGHVVIFDDAATMYEAARNELETLRARIQARLESGAAPTEEEFAEEERARARLFVQSVRLSRRNRSGPH